MLLSPLAILHSPQAVRQSRNWPWSHPMPLHQALWQHCIDQAIFTHCPLFNKADVNFIHARIPPGPTQTLQLTKNLKRSMAFCDRTWLVQHPYEKI